MTIKSSDISTIKPFIKKLHIPASDSHKGQNGKVIVIGGSSLFHSASLWAAEIASHFVDMVHYSSTKENQQIFINLKSKFQNGIVVKKEHLLDYVQEDAVTLVGPGMMRSEKPSFDLPDTHNFQDILRLTNEAEYTHYLTNYLLQTFPDKQFVLDAGALQMMDKQWLKNLVKPAIITPHQQEFEKLFSCQISQKSIEEKERLVWQMAKEYHCVILLKAVVDIVSDGQTVCQIVGGNAGLTKGGTGDLLAGLTAAFAVHQTGLNAAVLASFILKKTADQLFNVKGYWYNNNDLMEDIPQVINSLAKS